MDDAQIEKALDNMLKETANDNAVAFDNLVIPLQDVHLMIPFYDAWDRNRESRQEIYNTIAELRTTLSTDSYLQDWLDDKGIPKNAEEIKEVENLLATLFKKLTPLLSKLSPEEKEDEIEMVDNDEKPVEFNDEWLDKHVDGSWTRREDGKIDVNGSLDFDGAHVTNMPFKFVTVTGDFKGPWGLTSLEGSPEYVGGDFNISTQELTSLKGSPNEVGGNFNCTASSLTSLEGGPVKVGGDFDCSYNQLTSLKGSPSVVGGDFNCIWNPLKSLEGAPENLGGKIISNSVKGEAMKDVTIEQAIDTILEDKSTSKKPLTESYDSDSPMSASEVEIKKSFVQYMKEGNTFQPCGSIKLVPKLEPCTYNILTMPLRFEKIACKTDELYLFENSKMYDVLEEIKTFWTLKDNFDKLNLLHNRGILMYGPPGTGKSCLIQQVAEHMTKNGDIIIQAKNLHSVLQGLPAFRQVEEGRRVVIVFEDMDEYIGYDERNMLQLLDGANSTDNVLFLGSTNYIEKFPPRLLRPGRFDKKVKIGFPPMEGRLVYLQNKLGEVETEEKIQELADLTDNFSFGHLRELIIAGYAFKEEIGSVIERLKDVTFTKLPVRESGEENRISKNVIKG